MHSVIIRANRNFANELTNINEKFAYADHYYFVFTNRYSLEQLRDIYNAMGILKKEYAVEFLVEKDIATEQILDYSTI